MTMRSSYSFRIGNEEFQFEIMPPLYTRRPLQLLNTQSMRLEDRFHRTVRITRQRNSYTWTAASDIKTQYMNDLPAYIQRWLEDCFARWDLNTIPEGFE